MRCTRAELGTGTYPGALDDQAARAEEGHVLDDHRGGLRWLEHAADTDTTGQVHVLTDLGTGTNRGPGVDHRPGADVGTDVGEGGHEYDPRCQEGSPTGDGAGNDTYPVEAGLERYPVVVAEVADQPLLHVQDLEAEKDGALGALVDDDLVGGAVDEGHTGLALVDLVDRTGDDLPGVGVVGGEFGTLLPEFVDPVGQRAGVRAGHVHQR